VWVRLSARTYILAFERWRQVVHICQEEGKKSEFLRIVRTWSLRALVSGIGKNHRAVKHALFRLWSAGVKEAVRFDVICQRVFRRWQLTGVAACYRSWVDFRDGRVRARQLASRVFGRVMHGKVASAWAAWCDAVRYMQRYDVVCFKAAARLKQRSAGAALRRWCEYVDERHYVRRLV
jgi:hypothetical protein